MQKKLLRISARFLLITACASSFATVTATPVLAGREKSLWLEYCMAKESAGPAGPVRWKVAENQEVIAPWAREKGIKAWAIQQWHYDKGAWGNVITPGLPRVVGTQLSPNLETRVDNMDGQAACYRDPVMREIQGWMDNVNAIATPLDNKVTLTWNTYVEYVALKNRAPRSESPLMSETDKEYAKFEVKERMQRR